MSLVTIETEAFQRLMEKMEVIESKLDLQSKKSPLSENWLDNQDVCQLLHISKRTLQYYRDAGLIAFSQIGSKIYYRASDIEAHLLSHYKSNSVIHP
jgi:hypothetical protein